MSFLICGERKLTELDFARLRRLVATGVAPDLDEVLSNAEVVAVDAMPADVVTMYAKFIVHDAKLQRKKIFVLCYPGDTEPTTGHISVVSPAGMALIGLQQGEVAVWSGPRGEENAVRVEEILFQPEANGDYVK